MPNRDKQLRAIRKDYKIGYLTESSIARNPYVQLTRWLDFAIDAEIWEPNAMALATCGRDRKPSIRMVLLKDFDKNGLVFYTNYRSRKAYEISQNRNASLLFWWGPLERQVRIEGVLSKVSASESDYYFAQRPRSAQIGACASPQSEVIPNRAHLEALWEQHKHTYSGHDIKRPAYWGGYRLTPKRFEFWQGRASRLHDRIAFKRAKNGIWVRSRLAP